MLNTLAHHRGNLTTFLVKQRAAVPCVLLSLSITTT
jgi:hypothetical protein